MALGRWIRGRRCRTRRTCRRPRPHRLPLFYGSLTHHSQRDNHPRIRRSHGPRLLARGPREWHLCEDDRRHQHHSDVRSRPSRLPRRHFLLGPHASLVVANDYLRQPTFLSRERLPLRLPRNRRYSPLDFSRRPPCPGCRSRRDKLVFYPHWIGPAAVMRKSYEWKWRRRKAETIA